MKKISNETYLAQSMVAISSGDLRGAFAWFIDMPSEVREQFRANITEPQRQWLDTTWAKWINLKKH